jgi:hypothetical protein
LTSRREISLKNFQFPIPNVKCRFETVELGGDYVLYITSPGQLVVFWEYTQHCNLSELEKGSDLQGEELRIPLNIAKIRNYSYYTYSPKSKCNCLSLRKVSGRTCRFCEYKKRSSGEFLLRRKEKERGTAEQRRRNNEYNNQQHPNRTKEWREKTDVLGQQPGKDATNEINRRYRSNNPGVIKLLRSRYNNDKFLATPLWVNRDAVLSIEAKTSTSNAKGIERDTDHYIPLRGGIGTAATTFQLVCGLHCEENLRSISKAKTIEKGNTIPPELANNYSNEDIDYLRQKAKDVGLTKNGYLKKENIKRLYDEKKIKHPNLLKISKNKGPKRNKFLKN